MQSEEQPAAYAELPAEQGAGDTRPSQSPAETAPPEWEPRPITEQAPAMTEEQSKTAPEMGADNRMLSESDLSDYMQTGVRERKDGGVRLYLGKQTEDGHIIVVELISKGRRSLQPVTAWQNTPEVFEQSWGNKKRSPDYIPTAKAEDSGYKGTPGDGASSAPPEAFASADSIAQTGEEGKGTDSPANEQPGRERSAGLDSEEFSISERPERETTAQAVRQARQEEREKKQQKTEKIPVNAVGAPIRRLILFQGSVMISASARIFRFFTY